MLPLLVVRGIWGPCGQNVNHVSYAARCAHRISVRGGPVKYVVWRRKGRQTEQRGDIKQTNHPPGNFVLHSERFNVFQLYFGGELTFRNYPNIDLFQTCH